MKMKTLLQLILAILIMFSYHELSAKPGDLDSSFGDNGIVRTDVEINFNNQTSSIILDNGNIIMASECMYDMYGGVQLLCYKPDGSLNYDFGNLGRVETVCGSNKDFSYKQFDAFTIKLQDNKKIIAAGFSVIASSHLTTSKMLLIRYNLDGSIDSAFGTDGFSKYNLTEGFNNILNIELQSDGKIIAIAVIDTTTNNQYFGYKFILTRFTKDGSLDSTFGINGIVDIDKINVDKYKQPIFILKDDGIMIGGSIKVDEHYDYAICKYDKNGNLVLNFGEEGITNIHFSAYRRWGSSDILFLEDDKLLISDNYYSLPYIFMGIAIINTKGELLKDFGLKGKLFLQLPNDHVFKDVMLHQNEIIACGMIWDTAFVTRIGLDGKTDSSFGNDGYKYISQYQAINTHIYNNYLITTGSFHTTPSSFVMAKLVLDDDTYVDNEKNENTDLFISPNPIKNHATINYELLQDDMVTIEIYDSIGKKIKTLATDSPRFAGSNTETIDFSDISEQGTYFIRIKCSKGTISIKCIKE